MRTPPRHSIDSPREPDVANLGPGILRQTPQKPAAAAAPTGANAVSYFGQGMLRKTTTTSPEPSPRPSDDAEVGTQEAVGTAAAAPKDAPPAGDHSKPNGPRTGVYKGPTIPSAREADITPKILKHVERVPVRLAASEVPMNSC
jgi:hypothetical protein